jgi:hypothetical protein
MRPDSWTATPAYVKALLGKGQVDTSLSDAGVWKTAGFTVPAFTPQDKIEFAADRYRRKFGMSLEKEGFDVLWMGQPFKNELTMIPVDGDRERYEIKAWCKRRPKEVSILVPDAGVPEMQAMGLKLKDDRRRTVLVKAGVLS